MGFPLTVAAGLAVGAVLFPGADLWIVAMLAAALAAPDAALAMDEIASDLTISINALKSHIRSIYSKLGVSSRRCAVLAAHEYGLILSSGSENRSSHAPLIRNG
jgi:hypothetical protein